MKYDDASWHYEGDFSSDLPKEAGATHIGMFLSWMLLHDFTSPRLLENSGDAIENLRNKTLTGAQFLISELDEKLTADAFSEEGNAFAAAYYEGLDRDSRFIDDYVQAFSLTPDAIYRVADTWENYEKLATLIDARYFAWTTLGKPKYIA